MICYLPTRCHLTITTITPRRLARARTTGRTKSPQRNKLLWGLASPKRERVREVGQPPSLSLSHKNPLDDPKNLKTQRDPRVTVPNKNVRERVRLIRVPKNPQRIRVAKIFWVRKPEKDLKIWMKLVTMMKRSQRCLAAVDAGTPKKVASPAAIPCSGLAAQELRSRSDSFLFSWHDWLSVWAYGLVMACAFELQGQFLQVDMIGDALSHIISFQLIL